MNKNKNLIIKSIFLGGLFLLSFIFFNIFISSVMFILKINILKIYPIISLILSLLLNTIIIKKDKDLNTKVVISSLITILLPILIIGCSIFISEKFYDNTWDGNSYHKASIGSLMDGWNPVYEHMEDFDAKQDKSLNILSNSYIFGNHYSKASHVFAANISLFFNNIEAGKCITFISMTSLFLMLLSVLISNKRSILFATFFSLAVITCPTICVQVFNYYVDSLVYVFLFFTIFSLFLFKYNNVFNNEKLNLLIYIMVLSIIINVKFSAFGFAGIFCLGYYIYYIINVIKDKKLVKVFIKFTIASVCAVVIGVFVIGLSVYPKNLIDHGHPFYPIMGEDKIEIITQNQPKSFQNRSTINKFLISTFSESENIYSPYDIKPSLKIPFTIKENEFENIYVSDLRISGNGVFFSGILILSVITILGTCVPIYRKDKELFFNMYIPIIITIGMIFLLSESWWARYFPQIHLIPFFAILSLNILKNKIFKMLSYILLSLLLINSAFVIDSTIDFNRAYSNEVASEISILKNNVDDDCNIELYTPSFHGALYNINTIIDKKRIDYVEKKIKNADYNSVYKNFILWRCK